MIDRFSEQRKVDGETVRVFNAAKTVEDCFKIRKKFGALPDLRRQIHHRDVGSRHAEDRAVDERPGSRPAGGDRAQRRRGGHVCVARENTPENVGENLSDRMSQLAPMLPRYGNLAISQCLT